MAPPLACTSSLTTTDRRPRRPRPQGPAEGQERVQRAPESLPCVQGHQDVVAGGMGHWAEPGAGGGVQVLRSEGRCQTPAQDPEAPPGPSGAPWAWSLFPPLWCVRGAWGPRHRTQEPQRQAAGCSCAQARVPGQQVTWPCGDLQSWTWRATCPAQALPVRPPLPLDRPPGSQAGSCD